jgi:release factor glutamine methyltransferase
MPSTILDLLSFGRKKLKQVTSNYKQESVWILSKVMKLDSSDLLIFNQNVDKNKHDFFLKLITRRLNNEPLQYILESVYFYGHKFKINNSVFIPRQETEICIDILKSKATTYHNTLEVGCGLGCISITLVLEKICKNIDSIDVNNFAIQAAQDNAIDLRCKSVNFFQQNFFEIDYKKKYDLIVSNPPYIPISEIKDLDLEVKLYDPLQALTDYSDGLKFYKHLSVIGKDMLNDDGIICLEFGGEKQKKSIINIFEEQGFQTQIFCDLNKDPRFIVAS